MFLWIAPAGERNEARIFVRTTTSWEHDRMSCQRGGPHQGPGVRGHPLPNHACGTEVFTCKGRSGDAEGESAAVGQGAHGQICLLGCVSDCGRREAPSARENV